MADTFSWVEDRGATSKTEMEINEISFGDGYTHKSQKSLNPEKTTYNVSFINRDSQQIDDIVSFLKARGGYIAFLWQPKICPDTKPEILVTCNEWTRQTPIGTITSLKAVFELVSYGIEECP